jgi:ubiquinone/menaquinone biosynthesis C-methylase UbiE
MINRSYFLKKGGDEYFKRLKLHLNELNYEKDPVIKLIKEIKNKVKSLIEIGCGDGERLNYIQKKFNIDAYGVDPSTNAIRFTKHLKSNCKIGTADKIPFNNKRFDLILFGQSIMYFDNELLPQIISETLRILNYKGFILINDFYSKKVQYKTYKHYKKIKIRKMDNSKIFLWHPDINLLKKKIYSYKNLREKNNKVSIHLLKYNKKN